MLLTKTLPLLLLSVATSASPHLARRDLATITSAFDAISASVGRLSTGIGSITTDTNPQSAIDTLTTLSADVVSNLNSGTSSVTPTSALSLGDSITLLQSSKTLVTTVNNTVTDLIAKKPILDGATNADGIVVQQLQDQKTASQAFIAAVVSKVPASAADLANQQAQQVVSALNRGITAFGGTVTSAPKMLMI
jgi:hypothetical protein